MGVNPYELTGKVQVAITPEIQGYTRVPIHGVLLGDLF